MGGCPCSRLSSTLWAGGDQLGTHYCRQGPEEPCTWPVAPGGFGSMLAVMGFTASTSWIPAGSFQPDHCSRVIAGHHTGPHPPQGERHVSAPVLGQAFCPEPVSMARPHGQDNHSDRAGQPGADTALLNIPTGLSWQRSQYVLPPGNRSPCRGHTEQPPLPLCKRAFTIVKIAMQMRCSLQASGKSPALLSCHECWLLSPWLKATVSPLSPRLHYSLCYRCTCCCMSLK